jgi:DNA polymerase III alpha subunit
VITDLKHLVTTRGKTMAMFRLRSAAESIRVVVFPDIYARLAERLTPNRAVVCTGSVRNEEREVAMMLEDVVLALRELR